MTRERFAFASRVRAVLFDAGNTLMWIDHASIAATLCASGVAADEPGVCAAEMRARPRLDPFLRTCAMRESADAKRRYAALIVEELRASAATDVAERAIDAVAATWAGLWARAHADAAPTLEALAARGFVLGVVSNASGTIRAGLERAGLAARMGCIVDSGVEGVEKPDPRIFRIAAERIGVAPAACVYVGDFVSVDVEGARGAGMEAVLLDPAGAWPAGATPPEVPRITSLRELVGRL